MRLIPEGPVVPLPPGAPDGPLEPASPFGPGRPRDPCLPTDTDPYIILTGNLCDKSPAFKICDVCTR